METETKSGYKLTEVGLIPEDWEIVNLGQIAKIYDGTHQTPRYVESGVPFYSVEHVSSNDFENTKFITEAEHQFLTRRYHLSYGDVLMTRIGSIGVCKLIDWHPRASYYVSLAMLRFSQLDIAKFFTQYSGTSNFKKEIELHSLIYAIPQKINLGKISEIKIPLPPIPEQTAIANALKDTDDLIYSLESLIAKKKLIKQGAMQELLKPKDGWVKKKLGDLVDFYNGKAHENSITDNGDYIVVNSKFISTNGAIFKKSNECLFPLEENDITMVMSDIPNGKALAKCFMIPKNNKYTLNQRICALRSKEVETKFLFYILNRHDYFLAFDSGSGQTNLRKIEVLNCPINLPADRDDQKLIAKRLTDIDSEIIELENKFQKVFEIKQGMMQQLLTGKIRLI